MDTFLPEKTFIVVPFCRVQKLCAKKMNTLWSIYRVFTLIQKIVKYWLLTINNEYYFVKNR
jgi:hypothetical protein